MTVESDEYAANNEKILRSEFPSDVVNEFLKRYNRGELSYMGIGPLRNMMKELILELDSQRVSQELISILFKEFDYKVISALQKKVGLKMFFSLSNLQKLRIMAIEIEKKSLPRFPRTDTIFTDKGSSYLNSPRRGKNWSGRGKPDLGKIEKDPNSGNWD